MGTLDAQGLMRPFFVGGVLHATLVPSGLLHKRFIVAEGLGGQYHYMKGFWWLPEGRGFFFYGRVGMDSQDLVSIIHRACQARRC